MIIARNRLETHGRQRRRRRRRPTTTATPTNRENVALNNRSPRNAVHRSAVNVGISQYYKSFEIYLVCGRDPASACVSVCVNARARLRGSFIICFGVRAVRACAHNANYLVDIRERACACACESTCSCMCGTYGSVHTIRMRRGGNGGGWLIVSARACLFVCVQAHEFELGLENILAPQPITVRASRDCVLACECVCDVCKYAEEGPLDFNVVVSACLASTRKFRQSKRYITECECARQPRAGRMKRRIFPSAHSRVDPVALACR